MHGAVVVFDAEADWLRCLLCGGGMWIGDGGRRMLRLHVLRRKDVDLPPGKHFDHGNDQPEEGVARGRVGGVGDGAGVRCGRVRLG